MNDSRIAARGIVLLGCGKMGSAMLRGWLAQGLPAGAVWVVDPAPSDWLKSTGVQVNAALPDDPAVVLIAVKPQMMGDALIFKFFIVVTVIVQFYVKNISWFCFYIWCRDSRKNFID